jgi:hypothetical protein
LILAADIALEADSLGLAQATLTAAEAIAGEFRFRRLSEGNGMLIDAIRARLAELTARRNARAFHRRE